MTTIQERLRGGALGVLDDIPDNHEPLTVQTVNEAADIIDKLVEALERAQTHMEPGDAWADDITLMDHALIREALKAVRSE